MPELVVGGLTPLSTIDFPGALAAVVFCQGCPWRCRYCQNGHLVSRRVKAQVSWGSIRDFLQRRRGLLDAIVFSGGEPTLQTALPSAIAEVRDLGFQVGLHTAGCYPERLAELLPHLDWVGFDIKALPDDYAEITGVANSGERAWRSARLLVDKGIPHELRTTVHPQFADRRRTSELVDALAALGAPNYTIQSCVGARCLDPALRVPTPPPDQFLPVDLYVDRFAGFQLR